MKNTTIGYIYRGYRIKTGQSYIGRTVDLKLRIAVHRRAKDDNSRFHRSIRNHGFDAFRFEVLEVCSADDLPDREVFWIATLDTTNMDIGYNLDSGGRGGTPGRKRSEKAKAKMRGPRPSISGENNPNYGKFGPKHHCYGRKGPMTGKKHRQESIQKMRESTMGHVPSLESREKSSRSNKLTRQKQRIEQDKINGQKYIWDDLYDIGKNK